MNTSSSGSQHSSASGASSSTGGSASSAGATSQGGPGAICNACADDGECVSGFCGSYANGEQYCDTPVACQPSDCTPYPCNEFGVCDCLAGPVSSSSGGTSQPGGPRIDEFTAPATVMRSITSVEARVSDPDGPGDLSGGIIRIAGGATVTSFSGSAGIYHATLRMQDIHAASPLMDTGSDGHQSVDLEAVFYDQANHTAIRAFTVDVTCGNGDAVCDGTCQEVTDIDRCGACNNDCIAWGTELGVQYECSDFHCRTYLAISPGQTCQSVCADKGLTCDEESCEAGTGAACVRYWTPSPGCYAYRAFGCSTPVETEVTEYCENSGSSYPDVVHPFDTGTCYCR